MTGKAGKTSNKGEWSEVYVALRLLSDGIVYGADHNLEIDENVEYPILGIEIGKGKNAVSFMLDEGGRVIPSKGEVGLDLTVEKIGEVAEILLERLTCGKKVGDMDDVESFVYSIGFHAIKAASREKIDIKLIIWDPRAGEPIKMGFSVKSLLGGSPTLFNASQRTNVIYKLEGFRESGFEELVSVSENRDKEGNLTVRWNELDDIKPFGLVRKLIDGGVTLKLHGFHGDTFRNNLLMVDSRLPEIISEMLLEYYSGGEKHISQMTEKLDRENILGFDMGKKQPFYAQKIKKFLVAVATGMVPATPWMGEEAANGGYIAVRKDGRVICYNLYDRAVFEKYLFENTFLDTASPNRHKFGRVYKNGEDYFLKLNLQIRFRK